MSLINQMLQELDARRATAGGADAYGQQIRAVPERRGVHPAWWVALALAGALCGVLAWMLLRPPVSAAAPDMNVQLPLKLDADLNAVPAPMKLAPPKATAAEEQTPAAPPIAMEAMLSAPLQPVPVPAVKEAPPPTFAMPKAVAPVEVPAREVAAKLPEAPAPVVISKQVKELTLQQRAENEYRKSVMLLQQGKAAEAGSGFEHALQLDPHHIAARQTLIGLLLEQKRQDDALRTAREGLGLDSAQPGLAMIMARLQLERGEQRAAIDTLERTLPHAAERADYRAFLAALLQRDERHKHAADHYRLALQQSPQNGVWWMGLGISLQADQRTAEAQEAFGRAKATNSLSAELLEFVDARLAQLGR